MQCEMCGKDIADPLTVSIEGVRMKVCQACSSYGTILSKPAPKPVARGKIQQRPAQPAQPVIYIDPHAGDIIRKKRESLGMRQVDFARFLNERESTIHQVESGHVKPTQQLLDKLKDKMGIVLERRTAQDDEEKTEEPKARKTSFTLGDFIKK